MKSTLETMKSCRQIKRNWRQREIENEEEAKQWNKVEKNSAAHRNHENMKKLI